MRVDLVVENCSLATMDGPQYGAIPDGIVVVDHGRILWEGPRAAAPAVESVDRIDGGGGWLTPGLIDCHTQLVYSGDREEGHSHPSGAARRRGIISRNRE